MFQVAVCCARVFYCWLLCSPQAEKSEKNGHHVAMHVARGFI
jgi:hypothetical protein